MGRCEWGYDATKRSTLPRSSNSRGWFENWLQIFQQDYNSLAEKMVQSVITLLMGKKDDRKLVRPSHRGDRASFDARSRHTLFSWGLKNSGLHESNVRILQCGIDSLDTLDADYSVINFHPDDIIKSVVALPLQIAAFKIAKELADEGHKVVVCCGGKAAKAFLGYGENVTRWCGHTQKENELTRRLRRARMCL